jgi:hypothetical protein
VSNLVDAVKAGHLEGMRALRDALAEALDAPETPLYAVGGLSRELRAVLAAVAALEGAAADREPDRVDLLHAQFMARRSALNHTAP